MTVKALQKKVEKNRPRTEMKRKIPKMPSCLSFYTKGFLSMASVIAFEYFTDQTYYVFAS